jgi:hypothetical protein
VNRGRDTGRESRGENNDELRLVKPFIYYTSFFLALLFLIVAASAWTEVFDHGDIFAHPLTKSAAGWSMTGLMFLAVGLRGWRSANRKSKEGDRINRPGPWN